MSYKKTIKRYLAKFEDELWCYGYACILQGFKVYDTIMHVYYKDLKFMKHAIYGHLKSHRFVFLVSGHAGKEWILGICTIKCRATCLHNPFFVATCICTTVVYMFLNGI